MATESSSPSTTSTRTSTNTSTVTGTTPNNPSTATSTTSSTRSPPPTNDRDSNSCRKCVKALREIISGLHDDSSTKESPPLTLLKAIITDDWKSSSSSSSSSSRSRQTSTTTTHNKNNLKIQETEDGIKVELPVTTTLPNLLRRYSSLLIDDSNDNESPYSPHTLATSISSSEDTAAALDHHHQQQQQQSQSSQPLTIELKCRKCLTSGPEGGARAFLMGPQPLSIVLCHNRIHSSKEEVQEILTHELVHLYDVQTLQLDLQQCENLAYSEVRAAKAAECRNAWSQLQPYCVKQKAICATNNLFPLEGRQCIQKVFAQAFRDNRPFDNNNNNNLNKKQQQQQQP